MALEDRVVTHTGLAVHARKVGTHQHLSDADRAAYEKDLEHLSETEHAERWGAGHYEFYVELDGVPVVIGSRKAGTIDQRRAALAKAAAKQAAQQPSGE